MKRFACWARPARWGRLTSGMLLGWLASLALGALNLDALLPCFSYWDIVFAVSGGIIGLTSARKLLWLLNGLLFAVFLIVGFSPLARAMLADLQENESAQSGDAVVVLA